MSTQKVKSGAGESAVPLAPENPSLLSAKGKDHNSAASAPASTVITVAPTASKAKFERRHMTILILLLVIVIIPLGLWSYYLYSRAADQYVSTVGFTVQTEEIQSPLDVLGGLGSLSNTGSRDTDILYEFMQSQIMVRTVDDQLDLRTLYSKPKNDPLFSFNTDGSIEDLVDYWQRMVRVNYDTGTGLVELQVRAFSAQDAQDVAKAIVGESLRMINQLNTISREDTTRYAREELDRSLNRLKVARERLTKFRLENQIADPEAEIGVQTGLMNALQQKLSDSLIEFDLLIEIASETDPRVKLVKRKIAVVLSRIEDERRKFGGSTSGQKGEDFSRMIGDFESLIVDREFAEKSYIAALTAFDFALAEASRQSRYLAAYISPTLAETALHPRREFLIGIAGLFLLMAWAIMTLILYSIRDRR